MKKTLLLTLLISIQQFSKAQTFQYSLYFEDAIGSKDTLVIGYDLNATDTIDESFGEQNIIDIKLDSVFDVRISDAFDNNGEATFHSKKQILQGSCPDIQSPLVSIDIKCKNWPVTATWDSLLFESKCLKGSLFTSVIPGGWFDVAGHPSNLDIVALENQNQVTFTSNYDPNLEYYDGYSYINTSNDTIPYFWMTFSDSSIFTVNTKEVSYDIKTYPNPVQDFYYFDISPDLLKSVTIVDMYGRSNIADFSNGNIDMINFSSGHYLIIFLDYKGRILTKKIVKE